MTINKSLAIFLSTLLIGSGIAQAQQALAPPKPATAATIAANKAVLNALPFNDKSDFDDAQRGFIAAPDVLTIAKDADGTPAWDLESFKKFISQDKAAPDSVNPSLWRNAQLNMINGLFKVRDRIYRYLESDSDPGRQRLDYF